jgi:hypothetical protein
VSAIHSAGDRLRRATQLWHAYLAATGLRFELAQFLKDAAIEKQVLDGALVSGDPRLAALASEWLRDTGRPVPAAAAGQGAPGAPAAPATPAGAEAPKPNRYLRGVR